MARTRVTFEADNIKLFDTLAAMRGDTEPLGTRMVAALMTGDASFPDKVAFEMYGVRITASSQE